MRGSAAEAEAAAGEGLDALATAVGCAVGARLGAIDGATEGWVRAEGTVVVVTAGGT
jgi:hypothetical protein